MRFLLTAGCLLLLSACGQKGDLYLPVEGAPPPGAGKPTCATCPVIKVPANSSLENDQEKKIILEPQPQAADTSDKDKDKDKTGSTDTSTTDSTQETTQ